MTKGPRMQREYFNGFRQFDDAKALYEKMQNGRKRRKERDRQGRASMLIHTDDYLEGNNLFVRMSLVTALIVLLYFTLSRIMMLRDI